MSEEHEQRAEPLSAELEPLERRHLLPGIRSSADALGELLHDSFVEIGASGVVHSRSGVISALRTESAIERTLLAFSARQIAPGVALTMYEIEQASPDGTTRRSLRSSVWVRDGGSWKMIFHQGTPAPARRPKSL